MANIYQKTAIKLYEKGFGYMYSFPVLWSNDYTALYYNTNRRNLFYFKFSVFLNLQIALGSGYDIISWKYFDRPEYNLGIATLHLICAIVIGAALLYCYVVYINQEILQGANALFRVAAYLKTS